MKKFYALMAIATTLSASAAVSRVAENVETVKFDASAANVTEYSVVENVNGMAKAPAVASVDCYYGLSYVGMTAQDGGKQNIAGVQMRKVSDTEVEIFGLFAPVVDAPVKATYNASAQTLTIKPQQLLSASQVAELGFQKAEEMRVYTQKLIVGSDGKIQRIEDVESIVFTYAPSGVQLSNGTVGYVGAWVPESSYYEIMFNQPSNVTGSLEGMSGFLGGWKYNIFIQQLSDIYPDAPAFTFNASEWKEVGNSKLSDGWFRALDGKGYPAYDVKTYKNVSNPNHYLLENPYGQSSPYAQVNDTPNVAGYIYLDVTNPDCVLVRPNINSGFSNEELIGFSNLALTTTEGVSVYLQGAEIEDVIMEAEFYGDELPTVTAEGLVSLPNCRIQQCMNFEDAVQWQNSNREPIPMETEIQLAGYASVDGIINDADNAAKRYFNLQGVEIANPEAGQVVIVKEGNKATKTIVK